MQSQLCFSRKKHKTITTYYYKILYSDWTGTIDASEFDFLVISSVTFMGGDVMGRTASFETSSKGEVKTESKAAPAQRTIAAMLSVAVLPSMHLLYLHVSVPRKRNVRPWNNVIQPKRIPKPSLMKRISQAMRQTQHHEMIIPIIPKKTANTPNATAAIPIGLVSKLRVQ